MNKIIFYSFLLCFSFITVVNAMEKASTIDFSLANSDCSPEVLVKLSLVSRPNAYDGTVTFKVGDNNNCIMNIYLSKSLRFDDERYTAYSHVDKLRNMFSKEIAQQLQSQLNSLCSACVYFSMEGPLGDSELAREGIMRVDEHSVKQLLLCACGVSSLDKKDPLFIDCNPFEDNSKSLIKLDESDSENVWFSSYKWPVGILSASMIVVLCLYFFQFRK